MIGGFCFVVNDLGLWFECLDLLDCKKWDF